MKTKMIIVVNLTTKTSLLMTCAARVAVGQDQLEVTPDPLTTGLSSDAQLIIQLGVDMCAYMIRSVIDSVITFITITMTLTNLLNLLSCKNNT